MDQAIEQTQNLGEGSAEGAEQNTAQSPVLGVAPTAAIKIESLRKTYPGSWGKPGKEALKGVSLSIAPGETFGFIGPNGAGKSTLIKILIGTLRPSAGRALIFGCDVSLPAARQGLGFVPENPSLQDFLTPYEVLLMGIRLHGVQLEQNTAAQERQHCMDWLARFDLTAVADRPLRGFSKGMLQRTALAHALALKPRLLILDEPLSGLDPLGRKEVVDILDAYRRAGGTLFFSSHVLHDVERIADRFGLIHKGELKTVQAPHELATQDDDLVTVRLAGGAPLPDLLAEPGGRWSIELPRAQLWQALHRFEQAGHALIEVKPSLSLETAFLRVVKA
ncbi:MAG: ABC transporter ATP-binding protein [Pseudomonadota bacterium]